LKIKVEILRVYEVIRQIEAEELEFLEIKLMEIKSV
jgi:hypothetical protein